MAEQIAYRGQARERGFNPIQLSTAGVDAILQQGAGLSRQLRENQQIEETNRNRFQAAQETAQNLERANRQKNFELSESAKQTAEEARLQNLRTKVNDAQSAIRNDTPSPTSQALESLSKFSVTLFKQISEAKAKRFEEEQLQGYVDEYLEGPKPHEQALVKEGINQIRTQDELIQTTADRMQDTQAQPETVEAVRKLSAGRQLGRALARADMAVTKWPRYLDAAYENDRTEIQFKDPATGEIKVITPMDAIGPDQKVAVNAVLLRRFLQEEGLLDLNPKFLSKTLQEMRKAEDKLVNDELELYEKAKDNEDKAETFMQLDTSLQAGGDPIDTLREAIRQLTHQRDDQGRIRPLRAFQLVVDHLVKNGDMETLMALEGADSGEFGYQAGKTWGQLRAAEFTEARRKIRTQDAADQDLDDKVFEQRYENWSDEVVSTLFSSEGVDAAQVDAIIKASQEEFYGKVDPRILEFRDNYTIQARDISEAKEALEGMARAGNLTLEELDSNKYPLKLRFDPNFRRIAEEGSKKAEALSKGLRDQLKQPIQSALQLNAKLTGTFDAKPASFYFAEAHALQQMDKLAMTYMRAGKSMEDAYQQAGRDIVAQIEKDREGTAGSKQYGPYSFNDGEFGLFSSKANPGGQSDIAAKDVARTIKRVKEGGIAAITKERLIPKHILEETSDLSAPIPLMATMIANALPKGKSMSPYDIINAQRALYGLPPRQPDYVTQQIEAAGDPRLTELINRLQTSSRSSRAVLGAGMVGPGKERQAVGYIAKSLGVDPVDVATFIDFETAGHLTGGQYRRGLDTWGGDGGKFLGWIQMSPENQRKWGVRPGMNPMEQAQAVVNYLKYWGVKPGDPLHVIYQAVQAPAYVERARATGKNYLKDSNGSVSEHVSRMQKDHRPKVQAWLSQGAREGGPGVDRPGSSPYRDFRLMSAGAVVQLSKAGLTGNRGFGVQPHPIHGGMKMHQGQDYYTQSGTRLSMKLPGGIVDHIGDEGNKGYGKFVDIRLPDGSVARFAHLDKINVSLGQTLRPKQVFAKTGNTGGSTGPHLHMEHIVGGRAVDPLKTGLGNQIYLEI